MLELMTVISITIIVAVMPGPDFVVVLRNTIVDGRTAGLMTAAGISLALCMHVTFALAGIGVIISQSIILFNILKLIGAAYLLYLGYTMVKNASAEPPKAEGDVPAITPLKALRWGFLTNATNPKATMFSLSVFLQVTSPETLLITKIGYGFIMAGGVFAWFVLVTLFFTIPAVKDAFMRCKLWVERVFGVLLAAFGVGIALATNSSR